MGQLRDRTGQHYGNLTVLQQDGWYVQPTNGSRHAVWLCECECGTRVSVRGSNLASGGTISCGQGDCKPSNRKGKAHPLYGQKREAHPQWRGSEVGYQAAHNRVYALHGPASGWLCSCGCGASAKDWAYLYGAPDERVSEAKTSKGCAYSPDPDYYVPLARECHKRYDNTRRPLRDAA